MAKRNPKPSAGRSLWERQRDAIRAAKVAQASPATTSEIQPDLTTAPRFTFPLPAEPAPAPPPPAPGTYRIDQLRAGQCRFATTSHSALSHRFCGAATEIGPGNRWGAWCAEHLPKVFQTNLGLGRPGYLRNTARSFR